MPGAARDNFGIKRIERLDGNVGYLRFDIFSLDSSGAASVLRSALRALARTDALILDLRQNGGGNGALGQMLFSTFVPGPARATADMFTRTTSGFDSTVIMTAARIEPDTRYDERPLYVLTSARTASAAEWLAYNLQSVGRAKIVGEVTAGAAHPIRFVRLNDMFDAAIPIGRVRSRITKTDFEGVGVQPDIAVPVDRAFSTAYRELLGRLLAQTSDPLMKAEIERAVANAVLDIGRPSHILEAVDFHPASETADASPPRAPRISIPAARDRGD
jgi:C-terminal processing protease CtpA/Prc